MTRERVLPQQVKQAGGTWNPVTKLWELPYQATVDLGLEERSFITEGDRG